MKKNLIKFWEKITFPARRTTFNAEQANQMSESGKLKDADTRVKEEIAVVENRIVSWANSGHKGVCHTFKDDIILLRKDVFIEHFKQQGFEVKLFNNVVLILWN